MSNPPPFPVRLGIVALKATAMWVNTVLSFLQDEFPHPEEAEQEYEEQAQEQAQEQEQQDLLDEQQVKQLDLSTAASISACRDHFTEENYRRQLLSMLTSQVAVGPAAASSSSSSTEEHVRDHMNDNDEDNDYNNHNHNASDPPNDSVDHALQTDEDTVVNEVVQVAPRIRTEEATVSGATEILLALNRQSRPEEQIENVRNDEHDEYDAQGSQDHQDGQSQRNKQITQSEPHEQDEAQKVSPGYSIITKRITRGAVAMRNRMELESLQGAMTSAAAAEALEASRTRSQSSDDTGARESQPSVVMPRTFTFNHISTPAWPNGDVVYRFASKGAPRPTSWVWSEYSCTKNQESILSFRLCMGVSQCPKCGYAQRPLLAHRKRIPGETHTPRPPTSACRRDGTPLVHVGCSARLKTLYEKDQIEITHSNIHNHGKPEDRMAAKRTHEEMEGIVYEELSAEQGGADTATSQFTQLRPTVNHSAAIRSTRPQPSVMIDNRIQRRQRVETYPFGVHVDRTKGMGKMTSCSACGGRIGRKAIRVVHKVKDSSLRDPFRIMFYHTTCLSALSKSEVKKVQDILVSFGYD
ncbi:hypothetical protein BGZ67_002493 [Mortierella alpina]|nr:hypothetical protein BGZ67_002493 [Mortierella alpina]